MSLNKMALGVVCYISILMPKCDYDISCDIQVHLDNFFFEKKSFLNKKVKVEITFNMCFLRKSRESIMS